MITRARITVFILLMVVTGIHTARAETVKVDYLTDETPVFDPDGSIDDYIIYALKNNPDLKAAFYDWRSELEKAGEAAYLPDPVLSFGYFIESVETRLGPQRYRLGFRQSIPWPGKLSAKKDKALSGASAKYQTFLSKRAGIVLRVRTSWLDHYRAGRMMEIVKADMALLRGYESVALAGYRAGRISNGDLIRVQIELAVLEERAVSLEDELDTAAFHLLEAMGLPDSTILPVAGEMPAFTAPPVWEQLKEATLRNNPDIRAFEHLVEMGYAAERLAGRQYFPDMTIGIDYIETGDAIDPSMEGSGNDPWGVNVSFSIPMWFGRTAATRRSAAASSRMYRYRKEAKENEIVASAREAFNFWNESRRKAELYGRGIIPRTEQLLETTYSAYRGGSADFIDVISSQRQLLGYRIMLLDARVKGAKMAARLDYLAGFHGTDEGPSGTVTGR